AEPVFAEAMAACEAALATHVDWSLLGVLRHGADEAMLARVDVVQPMLFALGVALAALWRAWGVGPDAVGGPRMGGGAAAHVSGSLSLEDAARVICNRSRLMRRISGQGALAVVELPQEQAAKWLVGQEHLLCVAVSNSPRSTVVSGDPAALDALLARLAG